MAVVRLKASQAKVSATSLALVFTKFLINATNEVKALFDKALRGAIRIGAASGSEAHRS
jgi:hypothetical protein